MHTSGRNPASFDNPMGIVYGVIVPMLTGASLEHAMAASRARADAQGAGATPLRSARRTRADYGVGRVALHYLLTRVHGLDAAAAKHCSLLLRLQMLLFAEHDLPFVGSLGEAERTILNLAARQLACSPLPTLEPSTVCRNPRYWRLADPRLACCSRHRAPSPAQTRRRASPRPTPPSQPRRCAACATGSARCAPPSRSCPARAARRHRRRCCCATKRRSSTARAWARCSAATRPCCSARRTRASRPPPRPPWPRASA